MNNILNRNFIVIGELQVYLESLRNKIARNNRENKEKLNLENLEYLFKILKFYSNINIEYYYNILEKLKCFNEGFVIRNAYIITGLLELEKEERQMINLKFNDLDYKDDLKVLNLLENIENDFENEITIYVDKMIEDYQNSKEELFDKALDLRNRKNKEFIVEISDKILKRYPAIIDIPLFSKLFLELNSKMGFIAYEYLKNKKAIIEYAKIKEYSCYARDLISDNMTRKIKKEQCSNKKRL